MAFILDKNDPKGFEPSSAPAPSNQFSHMWRPTHGVSFGETSCGPVHLWLIHERKEVLGEAGDCCTDRGKARRRAESVTFPFVSGHFPLHLAGYAAKY